MTNSLNCLISYPARWVITVLMVLTSCVAVAQEDNKITPYELNKKIMAFSDNYQEAIDEITDEFIFNAVSPASRLYFQGVKVFYTHSAISIATEADAIHQLLDMMVMVRLQRIVWKHGGNQNLATVQHAEKMAIQLQKLETQLHKIARLIFKQGEINLVMSLTEKWRKDNPDRDYVAFVRFQDFAHSEETAAIQKLIHSGGLFSSITDAKQEIEETRHAVDRGLFLMNRLPILLEWQSELFFYKLFSSDEIINILEKNTALTEAIDRLSLRIDKWPEDVKAVVSDNVKPLTIITGQIQLASENLRVISEQITPLLASDENSLGTKEVLTRVERIVDEIEKTSEQLVQFSTNVNQLSYNPEVSTHFYTLAEATLAQANLMAAERVADLDMKLASHREELLKDIILLLLIASLLIPVIFFTTYVIAKRSVIKHQHRLLTQADKTEN